MPYHYKVVNRKILTTYIPVSKCKPFYKMSFRFPLMFYMFLCSCIPCITAGNREFDGDASQLWNEFREIKAVLSETILDLHNTRTELGVTKDVLGKELAKTKQALIETKELLDITGKKLDKTMEDLVHTRQDLADKGRELNETKQWIIVDKGQSNVIHKRSFNMFVSN